MSVSLLIGLLSYWNTHIMGYLQFWIRNISEIFWRLSWNVFTMCLNNSEFLVCLSVCWLAYFLTEIMSIEGYLQFWMRYLSDFFGDILKILLDCLKIILNFWYVLSVCWLACFLTEIMSIKGYLHFWMRYLSDFFGDIIEIFLDCFKIILKILYVCQSVSQSLISLLIGHFWGQLLKPLVLFSST